MADLDPATLPLAYVRCIRFLNSRGDLVTLTAEPDLKDFINNHPRFAGAHDAQLLPNFDRIEQDWLEEIAWIRERVAWLLSYQD